jgi:hypothetical protein
VVDDTCTDVSARSDGLITFDPTIGAHVARAAAHNNIHGADHALAMLDNLPAERVDNWRRHTYLDDRTHRS